MKKMNSSVAISILGFAIVLLPPTSVAKPSDPGAIEVAGNYLTKKSYDPNRQINPEFPYEQIAVSWKVQQALETLSQTRFSLARNEIYARHGQPFNSVWKQVFERVPWYHPTAPVTEAQLTAAEKENVAQLRQYEKAISSGEDRSRAETYDSEVQSLSERLVKKEDTAEALAALERLANEGNIEAQCLLAYAYDAADDSTRALPLAKRAAQAGYPGAQFLLARMYLGKYDGRRTKSGIRAKAPSSQSEGTIRDSEKARSWLLKAATQGKAAAQTSLSHDVKDPKEQLASLLSG